MIGTAIIAYAIKFTIGLRVDDEAEMLGIDESQHAESGYDFAPQRGGGLSLGGHAQAGVLPPATTPAEV